MWGIVQLCSPDYPVISITQFIQLSNYLEIPGIGDYNTQFLMIIGGYNAWFEKFMYI